MWHLNLLRFFLFSLIIFFVLPLFLVGCASVRGFPQRPEITGKKLKSLQIKYFLPDVDVLEVYEGKPDTEKKAYRDTIVHGRMLALDLQYGIFISKIYEENILSNLGLDIAGIGVGVAGAASTGATTSRALSAVSGGISGSRTAINKNLYYERTMPALIALMDAEREKVKTAILKSLTLDHNSYPMGRALTDLERYFQVGSIPGAISKITATAGEEQSEAENEITLFRDKEYAKAEAQTRIAALLNLVDNLPTDTNQPFSLLSTPPVEIEKEIWDMIVLRLGPNANSIDEAVNYLSVHPDAAKQILKMVVVMMSDRSKESVDKWTAAVQSLMN